MPSDSGSDEYPRAPAQKAKDENILAVFEATEDPVLTTAEVAAELPIGKRATLNRLEQLVERGELDSKDVGVGRVWWRAGPPESNVGPEPVGAQAPSAAGPAVAPESAEPVDIEEDPTRDESPRWAFVGSLGTHSIYAGIFVFGLLMAESVTPEAQLIPIPVQRLFLTAFVFFLIGFSARGLYRVKHFVDERSIVAREVLPNKHSDDDAVP